jgi:hypothetical protein
MGAMKTLFALALVVAAGCSKPVTSAAVCQQLVTAGVASNCRASTPKGLGARASEATEFDLPSVPGHGGQVFGFQKADDFDATSKSFESASVLAGPWRFGNAKALIFVQMNDGAKPDVGAKAKAVVDGL